MKIYNALLSIAYISCTIAMEPPSKNTDITLLTSDQQIIPIPYKHAQLSGMLRDVTQDVEGNQEIPVNFNKKTADSLIFYLAQIYAAQRTSSHVKASIQAHLAHSLQAMEHSKLYALIRAVDYLDIAPLMHIACTAWQEKSFTQDELDKVSKDTSAFSRYTILPTMCHTIHQQVMPYIINYVYNHLIQKKEECSCESFAYTTNEVNPIQCTCYNHNGSLFAYAGASGSIYIQQSNYPHKKMLLGTHSNWVYNICFHPANHHVLVSSGSDGTVHLWNTATQEIIHTFTRPIHERCILCFNPSGTHLVSISYDYNIYIWDIDTKKIIQILTVPSIPWSVTFLSDDLFAYASSNRNIYFWKLNKHTMQYRYMDKINISYGELAINPMQSLLAIDTKDYLVILLNHTNKEIVKRLSGHIGIINQLKFNHEGNALASASFDQTVRIWDVQTGRCIQILPHNSNVTCVDFSPNDTQLLTSTEDGITRVWTLIEPTEKRDLDALARTKIYEQMRFLFYAYVQAQKNRTTYLHAYPYLNKLFMAFDPEIRYFLADTLNIKHAKY